MYIVSEKLNINEFYQNTSVVFIIIIIPALRYGTCTVSRPDTLLRGLGRVFDLGMVEIEFSIVSDRGECQLSDAFYRINKYCS